MHYVTTPRFEARPDCLPFDLDAYLACKQAAREATRRVAFAKRMQAYEQRQRRAASIARAANATIGAIVLGLAGCGLAITAGYGSLAVTAIYYPEQAAIFTSRLAAFLLG